MAFVHQHQVVRLEGLHRNGFFTGFFPQLVYIDDLHAGSGEQLPPILDEQTAFDTRLGQLLLVLHRQALVRGQQNNPVEVPVPSGFLQVMLELQDVDVHDQGLATASGDPDGQLVQVAFFKGRDVLAFRQPLVERFTKPVQVCAQGRPIAKIPLQVMFGEQQGQVLEIQRIQGVSAVVTPFGDSAPVTDDVVIILTQLIIFDFPALLRHPGHQFVNEFTAVLLIETNEMIGGKGIAHRLQCFSAELRQHPVA